jgi:ketosteroid isomerase-like protein
MSAQLPDIVLRYFAAMQGGAQSGGELMALFHDDAEYIEPFTGTPTRHVGKAAIRDAMAAGWKYPLPDMRIAVDRFDARPDSLVVDWTCHSPGLPNGKGSGTNVFVLRDGLIISLETKVA